MIDRNQFVEELKLREQIRKAIKIIREKKVTKQDCSMGHSQM